MYLKNIEVHGFKSFAQKINFEFHNGITAIVGPNGSGKSNVGDAVRWVLGEQSAKQLRGGNMQDVIFSGTELRKPLSYAAVAITLDNGDHQLPVDYNEITITRRLYRSGESEYLLNGTVCRLKDINEMFYDTGIGKEGYSIIGQGQIDKILSGKPEDRRELFDEAAGIVKFKRRKNTTIKKLEEERQNLVRVTDILSEQTKQLAPLEGQAETAKIYLAQKEKLKELEVNSFLVEYEESGKSLKELEEKNNLTLSQMKEAEQKFNQVKEEYEQLERELEELTEKIEAARTRNQEKALLRQQMEGHKDVLKEQITAGEQSEEHYQGRLSIIQKEIEERKETKKKLSEEKTELHTKLREIRTRLQKEEEALRELQENISECTNAIEEGKNEIIELLNNRANTKGKVQRYETMMEQIEIHTASLNQRILSLKSEEAEQSTISQKAQMEYDGITQRIQSMNQQSEALRQSVSELQEEMKKQNQQLEGLQTTYHREYSRLESLRNITERYDGYGNSIRRVMEQKERVPGIHGVVADLIQVNKDYEIAIETALGGSIQNIVTDHEQTAKLMIEFLKKNRYGRATFLPLNSINSRNEFSQREALKEPGVIGIASELVTVEKQYEGLARYLLGRVLVVDHIDHAIAIARKFRHTLRMVTIEGESLNPGGSMSGGAFKNTSNLLGRRREIEELEEKVNAIRQEVLSMQQSLDKNRSERNVLRDTIADIQEKLAKQFVEQNTAKMKLVQLKEKANELKDGYEQIRFEQEDLRRQKKELDQDQSSITEELSHSQTEEKELTEYIETKQQELEDYRKEEGEILKSLEETRLNVGTMEQKESFISENLSRIGKEISAFSEEEKEIHVSLEQGKADIQKKAEEIQRIDQQIQECLQEETLSKEKTEGWIQEKEEKNGRQKEFFEKRDQLSNEVGLLDKECFRLKNQMEKLDEQREQQISYMWEEYELTPNGAWQYKKEELTDRADLKKQILEIKEAIRKLGTVNVNAIEDYKNLLERHTFMSTQYEDLKKAEETLLGIIKELDEGMRKQFSEKFEEIQREFDKAFRELFGGGKGTLELAEEEDILEAGIRIISQPPGKKLQNMMQLSGGEKALTAIALLFAIQNLKPSPFCLLDEIEAALDDSNVGRFAGYLQKLTKNTQFIIITHRRGTMNAADRLYGITMQEKGVSTLVSVDLVENQLSQ